MIMGILSRLRASTFCWRQGLHRGLVSLLIVILLCIKLESELVMPHTSHCRRMEVQWVGIELAGDWAFSGESDMVGGRTHGAVRTKKKGEQSTPHITVTARLQGAIFSARGVYQCL